MRTLVFGAGGFLGSRFLETLSSASASTADITDRVAVQRELSQVRPKIVINCVGKTGRPNIDWCEEHKPETLRADVTGPLVFLEECLNRDIQLVHIGSACVFQGDNEGKGFCKDDPPNFSGSCNFGRRPRRTGCPPIFPY